MGGSLTFFVLIMVALAEWSMRGQDLQTVVGISFWRFFFHFSEVFSGLGHLHEQVFATHSESRVPTDVLKTYP